MTMETLWTVQDAAKYLHVNKITVYRWLAEGKVMRTKVGGRTLIRESELLRIIEDNAPARELRRHVKA
jgi:excisionase family DNA binding protein